MPPHLGPRLRKEGSCAAQYGSHLECSVSRLGTWSRGPVVGFLLPHNFYCQPVFSHGMRLESSVPRILLLCVPIILHHANDIPFETSNTLHLSFLTPTTCSGCEDCRSSKEATVLSCTKLCLPRGTESSFFDRMKGWNRVAMNDAIQAIIDTQAALRRRLQICPPGWIHVHDGKRFHTAQRMFHDITVE